MISICYSQSEDSSLILFCINPCYDNRNVRFEDVFHGLRDSPLCLSHDHNNLGNCIVATTITTVAVQNNYHSWDGLCEAYQPARYPKHPTSRFAINNSALPIIIRNKRLSKTRLQITGYQRITKYSQATEEINESSFKVFNSVSQTTYQLRNCDIVFSLAKPHG